MATKGGIKRPSAVRKVNQNSKSKVGEVLALNNFLPPKPKNPKREPFLRRFQLAGPEEVILNPKSAP